MSTKPAQLQGSPESRQRTLAALGEWIDTFEQLRTALEAMFADVGVRG
jgi:hypothetical protein